ncbi:hypothetical protein KKG31_08395 [Patescibacteria group bacterium]|nr:hypothetical protein [Patescibacteria group bacterium]MBU1759076.1 hypothetical protein [Patescibacteria group bacterium]
MIGYTAFYRKGTEGEAHGYGLTALSDTKIFENTKRRLSDEQQKTGKERVVNKFSEKTNEKKQFTKKIKNILDAHNIDASELTNEQVISLIK